MKKSLIFILTLVLISSCFTHVTFAAEPLFTLTATDEFIIEQETITEGVDYDGPNSPLNQFPFLEIIDDTLFVSWSEHRDVVINDTSDAVMMSTDGGLTWKNKHKIKNFYPTSINKLPDGTLYGMNYNTRFIDDYTMKVFYFTSDDGGLSWTENEGKVHFDRAITKNQGLWASFAMHRTLMVMDDGSIQGVIYGTYKDDAYSRCLWIKSTDNGENYYVVSEIGSGVPVGADGTVYNDVEGFCEPVAARCLDGSLIAVMRIDSYKPLFYARSYDDGLTWTTPTTLRSTQTEQKSHS